MYRRISIFNLDVKCFRFSLLCALQLHSRDCEKIDLERVQRLGIHKQLTDCLILVVLLLQALFRLVECCCGRLYFRIGSLRAALSSCQIVKVFLCCKIWSDPRSYNIQAGVLTGAIDFILSITHFLKGSSIPWNLEPHALV